MRLQLRGPTQRAPENTPRGRNVSGPVKPETSDPSATDSFVAASPDVASPDIAPPNTASPHISSPNIASPTLPSSGIVAPKANRRTIIVIDQRVLIRDCLVRCLNAASDQHFAIAFASVS